METVSTKEKGFWKRLSTNSLFNGWLTWISFLFGIGSYFVNFYLTEEPYPAYNVISDIPLTNKLKNTKIKFYYDSLEVSNIKAAAIAIWNAGDKFLSKDIISKDKPITVVNNTPVKILDVSLVRKARTDLDFEYKTIKNKNGDVVSCVINGDDGFEANEGVTLLVLYTSNDNFDSKWSVKGRVKGYPKGFINVDDVLIEKKNASFTTSVMLYLSDKIHIVLIFMVTVFYIYKGILSYNQKDIYFLVGYVVFAVFGIIMFFVYLHILLTSKYMPSYLLP